MAYICNQVVPASHAALLINLETELVNMGWALADKYIPFTAGKNPAPLVGDELEGVVSGAKFNITDIVVTGGAWVTNNAAGFFGITNVTGQFQAENLKNNTNPLNPQATTTGVYHVVYSSNGEGGYWLTGYMDISILGNAMTLVPYMWWLAATHTGNTQGSTRTLNYVAGQTWVIVGDKDLVLLRRVSGAGDILFGHVPEPFHPQPFATLTAPCGAGMGVVMNVDNTNKFIMNQTYWAIDAGGAGRWRANVIGIGVGTLTVDNLGSALAAGSKFGANPVSFGASNSTFVFYDVWDRATTGNGIVNQASNLTYTLNNTNPAASSVADPDESLGLAGPPHNTPGLYLLQPLILCHDNGTIKFPNAISRTNFLFPPIATAENTFGRTADGSPIDTGTATAGANFTLTCLGKLWGINVHANKIVIIASGTGLGQTRRIASNIADTLTVARQWDTNPNATSIFFIVDEAYRIPTTKTDICYKEIL